MTSDNMYQVARFDLRPKTVGIDAMPSVPFPSLGQVTTVTTTAVLTVCRLKSSIHVYENGRTVR